MYPGTLLVGAVMISAAASGYRYGHKRSQALRGARAQGKMVDTAVLKSRGSPYRPEIGFFTPSGQWVQFTGKVAVARSDIGREFEVAYDPADPLRTAVVVQGQRSGDAVPAWIWSTILAVGGFVLIAYGIIGP